MNALANYASILRTISKPARLFVFSTVLYWVGMTLVQLYLNFFLQGMGLDQGWIGLINAAPQLTTVAFTLIIGTTSARLGPWKAIVLGTILAGLGILGISLSPGVWTVLAASMLNGVGGGFVWSNAGPFMMQHSHERARSTLFSLQAALGTLTGFFAYMIGGQLPAIFGSLLGAAPGAVVVMRVILVTASFFYMVSLVPIWLARGIPATSIEAPSTVVNETVPRRRLRIPITNPRLYTKLILPGALTGLGAGMTIPFINLYIERKFNVSFEGLGQLFAWTSIATALALMVQPLLADKFGKVKSVVLVQGASLPFLLVLGYSPIFPLVVAALFVRGALMNMGNPIFSAYSMERVPERERATFSSLTSSTWSLGWAAGSWFSGTVRDAVGFLDGFNILFGLMTILYAIPMIMMWVWFVREDASRRATLVVDEQPVHAA